MSKDSKNTGEYGIGIDIGGTGIKGGIVELDKGELLMKRVRVDTPKAATPDTVVKLVADVVEEVVAKAKDKGVPSDEHAAKLEDAPLGVTFPGIVKRNVAHSAVNLGDAWLGLDVGKLIKEQTGHAAVVVNDADAAGIAEVNFGAAKKQKGTVIMTTLGTGIGSAVFLNGRLVPNTELGHLEIDGADAESRAAESARERESLSWEDWAKRLQRYYSHVEFLFSPDLFIVGGGVSKSYKEFLPLLDLKCPIVPAGLFNEAGIVGAAILAFKEVEKKREKAAKKKH